MDPFGGYKSAIDDQLEDATAVLDAFHVVKLGTQVVDEVRRRVQHDTIGHRGRKGDPLIGIQTILRAGAEKLPEKQQSRLARAIEANERHEEVFVAWQCPSSYEPPTGNGTWLTDVTWPSRPSPRSTPARSRMSRASDGPCAAGGRRSWPT